MRAPKDDTVVMHFLLYTRSQSFDYQWIYGLDDKTLENALQEHLSKWLSVNLLASLPPVTTLFRFQKYCVLMIAEESDTRNDQHNRAIFQRAAFLWEPVHGLYYRHLEPLANVLAEEAQKVYNKLPNDVLRLPPKTVAFRVDIKALDKEVSRTNLKKCQWELPDSITWQDVLTNKLTVEVPGSWSFYKTLAGLPDQPLSQPDIVFIGNSLRTENRFTSNQSWIVSAKESNGGSNESIRVLKTNGQTLQIDELKKWRAQQNPAAGNPGRVIAIPASVGECYGSLNEENEMSGAGKRNNSGDSPEITTPAQSGSPDMDELERLFREFSNAGLANSKTGKWELTRIIKRFLERNHLPLVEAQTRILFVLTPASLNIPSDIMVAWHYLLSEILLSYQNPSKEMLNEWIDRTYRMEDITTKNISRPQDKWLSELKNACDSLRTILRDL